MEEGRSAFNGQWASLQAQPLQAQPSLKAHDDTNLYKVINKDQLLDPLPITDQSTRRSEKIHGHRISTKPWNDEDKTTNEEPWSFKFHGSEEDKAMLLASV